MSLSEELHRLQEQLSQETFSSIGQFRQMGYRIVQALEPLVDLLADRIDIRSLAEEIEDRRLINDLHLYWLLAKEQLKFDQKRLDAAQWIKELTASNLNFDSLPTQTTPSLTPEDRRAIYQLLGDFVSYGLLLLPRK
jgi:hypothetical protein